MPGIENELSALFPRTTTSPEETRNVGEACAGHLTAGSVIALVGSLGAGKTQFVKGLARGFGINPNDVSSPTFSIVHEYGDDGSFVHMDLYRLNSESEVADLGFEEYIESGSVIVVEWPQVARELFPSDTLSLSFSHLGGDKRVIELLSKPSRTKVPDPSNS